MAIANEVLMKACAGVYLGEVVRVYPEEHVRRSS
jgi:hypothetical protein